MSRTDTLGWALVHFLWQGAAIGAIAWILLRVIRQAAPRYVVTILALALMPVAVAVTVLVIGQSGATDETSLDWVPQGLFAFPAAQLPPDVSPSPTPSPEPASDVGVTPPSAPPSSLLEALAPRLPLIVAGWIAGVLILSVRLLGGLSTARRLTREGTHAPQPAIQRRFEDLCQRLNVARAVRLVESSLASVPSVVGWIRPVILLPASALTGLTTTQIELLLAHELAHVRRHDFLVNLLQCAIETLLFYHPVVWWLSRRAREERELCCDDIAVAAAGTPREYAETLVALERLRAVNPELAMAATGGSLLPRIRRLLEPEQTRPETFPRWLAGAAVMVVVAASGLAASLPGAAGPPDLADAADLTQEPEKHADKAKPADKHDQPIDRVGSGPDTVISHPDPSRPLAERLAWARTEAGRRKDRSYWIAYTVRPPEWLRGAIYVGRGIMLTDDGQTTISGDLVNIGDPRGVTMPGRRLLPLLGGNPDDIAIIHGYQGSNFDEAVAVSLALPFNFHTRPIYYLGSADDDQSLNATRELLRSGRTPGQRSQAVRLIGIHRNSDAVVPLLINLLEGNEPEQVRREAASWLGRHPRREALSVLDRTARRDRSRDVRKEAAESIGEMELPAAFDVLVRLVRELDDAGVRQEAVEGLGERPEADAAKVLGEVARRDPDRDVQREAAETLGELSDGRGLSELRELVLNHPSADVRAEAVETWGEAAPPDQAVSLLQSVVDQDPSDHVRQEAVETLTEVRDGKGMPVVIRIAREHRDSELRREAVEEVAQHLPIAQAVELLKSVVEGDPSDDVRREAVETLGELRDPKALAVVADVAARHPRAGVRQEAVETYGEQADPAEALTLFKKLVGTEQDEGVLSEIFETAVELDGADGVGFVMDFVRGTRDTHLRAIAVDELEDSDDRRAKAVVREFKREDDKQD